MMSEQNNHDKLIELLVPIIEPLAERQDKIEQALQAQEAVLVELTEQLDALTTAPPKSKPSPWNLYDGDTDENAELLTEINQWIPWLNTTYGAGQSSNMIPSCWFQHPHVVAHLMGLYVSWKAANYGSKTPDNDLVFWNLRYLPDVLDVVNAPADKGGMAGCRREHRTQERVDSVPEPLNKQFAEWLIQQHPTTTE